MDAQGRTRSRTVAALIAFLAMGVPPAAARAQSTATNPANIPAELPLTLDLKVTGAPEPSSPNFAANLPGPAPSATPAPAATPTSPVVVAAGTDAGDPTLTIGLVAVLALAGGLALGVLAVIVLGVGRRRSAV